MYSVSQNNFHIYYITSTYIQLTLTHPVCTALGTYGFILALYIKRNIKVTSIPFLKSIFIPSFAKLPLFNKRIQNTRTFINYSAGKTEKICNCNYDTICT